MYHLNLDWRAESAEPKDFLVRLASYQNYQPGSFQTAEIQNQRFQFPNLSAGSYLLSVRYRCAHQHFDSFYFQLDIPDITLIQVKIRPEGAQIEQMGFLNDYGEFVDMLIYQGQKPYLTFALESHPFLESLTEFLSFRLMQLAPSDARQRLHLLLGDLSQSLEMLSLLWPYQLKMLISPALLAQTTVEWKACLMHLLRNHLILMDDELLYEYLQEAVQLAQEEDRFAALLNLMEWDPDTQDWQDYPGFLQALQGHGMLKPPRLAR